MRPLGTAALSPNGTVNGPLTIEDQKLLLALKSRMAKGDTSARKLGEAVAALVERGTATLATSDAA